MTGLKVRERIGEREMEIRLPLEKRIGKCSDWVVLELGRIVKN
jgi:hypothetical protein